MRWTHHHALCLVLVIVALGFGLPMVALPVAASLSIVFYLFKVVRFPPEQRWGIGAANTLTLIRGLLMLLVFMGYAALPVLLSGCLLVFILALDGLDGYVARRWQESSLVGQYLDVEMDALFVAFLSVLLWRYSGIPIVILFIGSLRYLYLLVLAVLVPHEKLEPKRRYASVIAVFLLSTLIARLTFSATVLDYLLILACILVVLSFSRSLVFQLKNNGPSDVT